MKTVMMEIGNLMTGVRPSVESKADMLAPAKMRTVKANVRRSSLWLTHG